MNKTLATIRCQDGWKEVDAVRQLAVHDRVLAALRTFWTVSLCLFRP